MERSKFRQTQQHGLENYETIQGLPIKNQQRRCTDILCIIVGITLTVVLAIFAILTFNNDQYLKEVFPADSEGQTCGYEYPGYNYLYFSKPTDISSRYCVRSCPSAASKPIQCKRSADKPCEFGSEIEYYDNEPVENEYGMFCLPKDEKAREVLRQQMKSYNKDLYYNSINVASTSLIIVAVISFLYMFLVQCFPRAMNRISVVVGVLALLAVTITVIVYPSNISAALRWIVFAVTLLFILILVCNLVKYFSVWSLNGVFLEFASKCIATRPHLFVLPIIFLGLGVAFYFFQILMYRSFWSFGQLQFDPANNLYHHVQSPTLNLILTIFQIIQIIWGTMFLKQSFNYLVSAQSVQWYYGNPSNCLNGAFTLVCKHLGSVIASAFMSGFFGIADFIFDALLPASCNNNDAGINYCCNRFAGFFDLARSDALGLVYLSGNSYCNSARYSEYLAQKSNTNSAQGQSQSASRIYRIAAHFALAGITTLVAFWLLSFGFKHEVAIPAMLILLLISIGVATFFISLHADAGEAILVLYLMEEEFRNNRSGSPKQNGKFNEIDQEVRKQINARSTPQTAKI